MIQSVLGKPFLGMNAGGAAIKFLRMNFIWFKLHSDNDVFNRANKNIVLATAKHGGHLAFFEGISASSLWYYIFLLQF